MSTKIYYFSAGGSSLALARDLAARLNGHLTSIAAVMDRERIHSDASVIGLVFPVYYASLGGSGVPLIVERFVGKLDGLSSKYVFAICTHSGTPGSTIENLGHLIASCQGQLAAGFAVKMGIPYATGAKLGHFLFHQPLGMDPAREAQERQKLAAAWQKKLEVIYQYVSSREKGPLETRSRMMKTLLGSFVALQNKAAIARYRRLAHEPSQSLQDLIPLADRSFHCDPNCMGCGICARVCPVHNIEMVSGRPVWQHRCETCYACYQWCPQGAINGDLVEYEKRRHHEGVKLADVLRMPAPAGR